MSTTARDFTGFVQEHGYTSQAINRSSNVTLNRRMIHRGITENPKRPDAAGGAIPTGAFRKSIR